MMEFDKSIKWAYVLVPAIVIAFLAFLPQLALVKHKGLDWHGSSFTTKGDEAAYMAYTNALINGRPRRNDPFLGTDSASDADLGESFYSIQFVPAYSIAVAARLFSLPASTAFILLNILAAFFSSLSIFFLVRAVTRNHLFAASATSIVLCLGTAAALQGQVGHRLYGKVLIEFFTFLRSYQPSFSFPLLFLFSSLVWKLYSSPERTSYLPYAIGSGCVLVALIFSYFYLWTAAIAWFGCISILWLLLRRHERKPTILKASIVGGFGAAALIPYVSMLFGRSANTDQIQALSYTRAPDLTRHLEITGFLFVAAIVLFVRYCRIPANSYEKLSSPITLFAISFALTPSILFNQQVITGRSLQPFHYDIFVANYMILIAFVLMIWLFFVSASNDRVKKLLLGFVVVLGVAAVGWGYFESSRFARREMKGALIRDEAVEALEYIDSVEKLRPTNATSQGRPITVFSADWSTIDLIPGVTRCRPLWNMYSSSAGGIGREQEKELFYTLLYYSDFDERQLTEAIAERRYFYVIPIFGFAKVIPELGKESEGITQLETDTEIQKYAEFTETFDRAKATGPILDYAVVRDGDETKFLHIDKWYVREKMRKFNLFTVYRLTLKVD